MKRRTFLKNSGVLSLATLVTPSGIFQNRKFSLEPGDLESKFKTPPYAARPHTWWHWMNGNVTREGITLDLEAMARIGLGGFQNFDAGTGIPKGPVVYLSPEWLELKKHAIHEAERLGLEFTMHNCPGWSSSGGPWITPELSMKEVTWSELFVEGGRKVNIKLPKPFNRLNFYKEIKTIAYRSLPGEIPFSKNIKTIFTNKEKINISRVTGEDPAHIQIQPSQPKDKCYLQVAFRSNQDIQQLSFITAAYDDQKGPIHVEVSSDGVAFHEVATINTGSFFGEPRGEVLVSKSIPKSTCIALRFVCDHARQFTQIRFSNVTRSGDWEKRANFAYNRYGVGDLTPQESIKESDIIDLTNLLQADGALPWDAPKGDWTVLRVGFTSMGTLNRSAPDTGIGLECDKYSAKAIEFHFSKMMENLLPSLKALGTDGKVGLLIDSYEVGMQNWTDGFEKIFAEKNGYDLANYLPTLTGRSVIDSSTTDKFLWDLRRTQGDLMADHYYGMFTELCHKNNMISYCQPYDRGPMEEMQIGSRVDTNVGEFWHALSSVFQNNWTMRRTVKLSAAIAHTNGQKIVAAESYTGEPESSKWQEYPFGLKALGDKMFTQGLNRMVFHRFAHQPHPTAKPGMTMGAWGSHFDRTNTWWEQGKSWVEYLTRCQCMLQEGNFSADLLYYTGEDAGVYTRVEPNELVPMPPEGFDYDLINAEVLLNDATFQNGKLVLTNGMSYRMLIMQDFKTMSLRVAKKLSELVNAGLIVVASKPDRMPGLARGDEQEFKSILNTLWGNVDGTVVYENPAGKGKISWGKPLEEILHGLEIGKDFDFSSKSGDAPIRFIHRKTEKEDIYFLTNQRRSKEELVCTFRIANKQPEIWNPVNGKITSVSVFKTSNVSTSCSITLGENESLFVVFRKEPSAGITAFTRNGLSLVDLNGYKVSRKTFTDIHDTFTMSLWVKPENNVMLGTANFMDGQDPWTDYYTIFPSSGEKLYGKGHSTCGLAAGRNGVAVWEHASIKPVFQFSAEGNLSGWSHLALVYDKGVPSLYMNGKFVKSGIKSEYIVHPGLGHVFLREGASFYNGDISTPELFTEALSGDKINTLAATIPDNASSYSITPYQNADSGVIVFEDGTYELTSSNKKKSFKVDKIKPQDLSTSWNIKFPKGYGAPATIQLDRLVALNTHRDDGVKYFSGTCTYNKRFTFDKSKKQTIKYFLDLGEVENVAEVKLNGKSAGVLWTRPFRIDVTDLLSNGVNELEINVTNLWPNRLIGDEQQAALYKYSPGAGGSGFASLSGGGILELPEWYKKGDPKPDDGKTTFATWQHYKKDSPLLQSGLIGPVKIIGGVVLSLNKT